MTRFLRLPPVFVGVAVLALVAGCGTTSDLHLESAKAAYGDGMTQYDKGNYDAASA